MGVYINSNKIFISYLFILSILIIVSSCDTVLNQEESNVNRVQDTQTITQAQILQRESLNQDERTAQLAKEIDGFGGLFINQSGQLSIYLTQPDKQKATATSTLSGFKPLTKTLVRLRSNKNISATVDNMNIRQGQYKFINLYDWKKKITNHILPIKGVYTNDIDESQNKLSVGVSGEDTKDKVIKELAQLNIPREAVNIFTMSQPKLLTSLQDQVSSFSGGVKITIDGGPEWCTMGPTVRWRESSSGPFVTGYITASHCTPPLGGGVNGTQFYQPISSGNYAGIEISDPLFAGNKCWDTGSSCRESDAALISYSNASPELIPGSIYKTTSMGRNTGSIIIPTNNQRFYIKNIQDFIVQGVETHKVGANTGWTYGNGTSICQDFTVDNETYVCQNVVQAGADHGDSGSPVFETTSSDSVIFYGTLSGGFSSGGNPYYWYSSVTRIENDLSGSNVHDLTFTAPPPTLSTNMVGNFLITMNGNYTWDTQPEHGTGSYAYQWEYRDSPSNSWSTVASTKTYTRNVLKTIDPHQFYLRVTVTSGTEQASVTRSVNVTSSDCPPFEVCPEGTSD